jgi:hypothetical protein
VEIGQELLAVDEFDYSYLDEDAVGLHDPSSLDATSLDAVSCMLNSSFGGTKPLSELSFGLVGGE